MLGPFQPSLLSQSDTRRPGTSTSGSFVDNTRLPVHRWFRYSAGFSGAWAEALIAREAANGPVRVFDPFAGSATTLIAAEQCGIESRGIDPHPFVARIAQAKLAYRSAPYEYLRQAQQVLACAKRHPVSPESYGGLIRRCYTDEALEQLDGLRRVIDWLGKLAVAAGFRSYRFEKIRDRNTKWKNRKHRVPLCEGRLWVEG